MADDAEIRRSVVRGSAHESEYLYFRYLLTHNLDDINEAVELAGVALVGTEFGDPCAFRSLHYGRSLLRKFQHTRQAEDLTEAMGRFQHVLRTAYLEDDHSTEEKGWKYLSIAHLERDGNLDAFRELYAFYPYVKHHCLQSRPSLETLTQNLCEEEEVFEYLSNRSHYGDWQELSNFTDADLDDIILFCRGALSYCSSNAAHCELILRLLGTYLGHRYERGKNIRDIIELIECCSASLELLLPNSASHCLGQSTTSRSYVLRFWALREPEDLEKALRLAENAVDVIELRYPHYDQDSNFASCFSSLSFALDARYHATEDVKYLDAAIHAASRAVDISAEGSDMERVGGLEMLKRLLTFRYQRSGRAEDLSEINAVLQNLLRCWPPDHPKRVVILAGLAGIELEQYWVHQDDECLVRARTYASEAFTIPSASKTDELQCYNVFSLVLLTYAQEASPAQDFGKTKVIIEMAMDLARRCVSNTDSPMIDSHLIVCSCLRLLWQAERNIRDLEEAISEARCYVKLAEELPAHTRYSVHARMTLGLCLHDRFKCTRDEEDREEALSLLYEGFRGSCVRSNVQIVAGNAAIAILIEKADWASACNLSREVIDLLAILNDRSQAWPNKESLMRSFDAKAATCTSVALQAGSSVFEVIDMLESCRGSILGHLMDKRTDPNDLPKAAREKANQFRRLQDEVSTVMHSFSGLQDVVGTVVDSRATETRNRQIDRKIKAEREIRACLEEIRSLEGCHRFLLGPSETELRAAAARGPIVIVNVSALRSDAIIITTDAFDSMDLPQVKVETVQKYTNQELTNFSCGDMGRKNRHFRKLQEWLWASCVQPIFERLKHFGYGSPKSPGKFHVCWMGVGVASFLPFHAAGNYTSKNCETALSQAISSYFSTLRVLVHSQRKLKLKLHPERRLRGRLVQRLKMKKKTEGITPRLTVITMPSTPGMGRLFGVEKEANQIQTVAGNRFSIQKFVQPSAKETIGHMTKCDVLHLACHGKSNGLDPSSSSILLQAVEPNSSTFAIDKLILRDVVDANFSHGKLAFLSACSTAQNENEYLQDEVLHLVSGFQVAGYSHVIGNVWPADDDTSVELVTAFYEHLVAAGDFGNVEHVAEALNAAVLRVAKRYPKNPLSWAQYVHYGF